MVDEMDELLHKVNGFFKDMNLSFTIHKQIDAINNNDNNYFFKPNVCNIFLTIYPKKYIYINNIEKCLDYTGTEILQKIIKLGSYLQVEYIELSDYSMVDSNTCNSSVAFAAFEILTSGSSWYNKHGFKSTDHDNDTIQNAIMSNKLFDIIIPEQIKINFKHLFPDIITINKTIKDVLLELKHRYLKRGYTETLNEEQCNAINDLTMYLNDNVIFYNNRLKLFLGGKKQKQKQKQKTKTKNKNKKQKQKTKTKKTKHERNRRKKLKI
jgi:hypothetical protein